MKKILRYMLLLLPMLCMAQATMAQADRQFIRSGNRFYRQGNYAKAELEYRKALSQNKTNTQAMYNFGCALMMQQKDSDAVSQFVQAGRSETAKRRKAACYHNIGVICQNHQMYGEAIQAYEESLRNNPSDNETRYNLALCKRLQKKQKQNKGGGKNNKNNKDKQNKNKQKQNKDNQNKDKKNKNQDKNQQQKQPQPKDQMSKENAEQLLNAAMQEEKATQQRLKSSMQQPRSRRLQKNW